MLLRLTIPQSCFPHQRAGMLSHGDQGSNEPAALPPEVIHRLGELLQAFYEDLQREPVPERLIRILDVLDQDRTIRHGR